MLNFHFYKILPYCTSKTKKIEGSSFDLLDKLKTSLLSSIKMKYVNQQIQKLPSNGQGTAQIKRHAAARFIETGKCDHTGEFTIFGQLLQIMKRTDS
jgi:hypothetical protein